ncbi:MAG TPA: peroxiredoxin-like family protein [Caulobacteraceae bacterium]|nr:peroxiredoxin-like family protein [Caulobacteraceae bacterium]
MLLKPDLERFRAEFMAKAPAEVRSAMARADVELAASGLIERALKAGDAAPDFALPEARGGTVRLSARLSEGPVVLSFFRGGWCPYCSLELRALQTVLGEIRRAGAELLAISPQTLRASRATAEQFGLAFPVLSDARAAVATAFGVVFDLADELRPLYARFGHALPDRNGDDSWRLPIPATYVIDRDQTVALAFLDIDYSHRLEPADIVATVAALRSR